jgi:hypothetical protein
LIAMHRRYIVPASCRMRHTLHKPGVFNLCWRTNQPPATTSTS